MRNARKIVRFLAALILSAYLLLLVLVNFGPAEQWLTRQIEDRLAEVLQTEVSIGRVELGLFNRATLHDVVLKDQAGKTMLQAGLLSAKVEVMAILRGDVTLRTVSLLDANVHLYKEKKDSPTNFQFVIDAFSSKDKTEQKPLNLCINSIIIRRCNVQYDALYQPTTPQRLNPAHLAVKDIDASISLKRLTSDSLNLRVRSLSLEEQSGLHVRSLRMRLAAGRKQATLEEFHLALGQSEVTLPRLQANYDASSLAQLLQTIELRGHLPMVSVSSDDFVCLVPELRNLHQKFLLTTDYAISPKNILLNRFSLSNSEGNIQLLGRASLARTEGKFSSVDARVDKLAISQTALSSLINGLATSNPKAGILRFPGWHKLGDLTLQAQMNWATTGRHALTAQLHATVGQVEARLQGIGKSISGEINVEGAQPDVLLGNAELPTGITLTATGNCDLTNAQMPQVQGKVNVGELTYKNHRYENILLEGSWIRHNLQLAIASADPAATLDAQIKGHFDGRQPSDVDAHIDLRHLNPSALGLNNKLLDGHTYAATIDGHLDALPLCGLAVHVKDFQMDGRSSCYVPFIDVQLQPSARGTHAMLNADFARVEVDGPLGADAIGQLARHLRSTLLQPRDTTGVTHPSNNEWEIRARCTDTEFLNKVLDIDFHLDGDAFVEGRIGGPNDEATLSFHTPGLQFGSTRIGRPSLYLRGSQGAYSLLARGNKQMGQSLMTLELNAQTRHDTLTTHLAWVDEGKHHFCGAVQATTLAEAGDKWLTRFHPTDITIKDTLWQMSPGSLRWSKEAIEMNRIGMQRAGQSLHVSGRLSRNPNDVLTADLKRIDVDYILSIFNIKPVEFGGHATGQIHLKGTLDTLSVSAPELDIPEFRFNKALLGHARIKGGFSTRDGKIMLDADIREEGVGYTMVKGYVSPKAKELYLQVNNKNTNLGFLDRYITGIFGPIEGRVSGDCLIHGKFQTLDFKGVEHGEICTEILATGVPYHLTDGTVTMSDGRFDFQDFKLSDRRGGTGSIRGYLGHQHLKNITYDFQVEANKLLVYDQARSLDLPFYATAFGTGRIHLMGRPGSFSADISMRPEAGTRFYYMVESPETFSDGRLLRFQDADSVAAAAARLDLPTDSVVKHHVPQTASTDIRLDFALDMTPQARLFVIMDDKTGDRIELGGTGMLQAKFHNKGDFTMNGNYVIADGNYKMSIQDLIRKEFVFRPGGNINFTGIPFESDLNLRAVYTVPSVSLSDLNIGNNLSESSVPVGCVLNFGGKVGNPQITFDLELPRVSDDINRMVRSLISSEEDMNMQVLYLLGVGRFYTYDYASTEAAAKESQSSVAMKSFLSNTLSSQLNNILSNAMGNTNWTFGANLSTGRLGWNDMEVEGMLSGRLLNNRLIINGQFGYRDRPQYSNTNFVGDFNINYLLTPSGSVSLKAYSETNDRYFTKSSLTTQGAGIELKRSFSKFRELFTIRKKKKL